MSRKRTCTGCSTGCGDRFGCFYCRCSAFLAGGLLPLVLLFAGCGTMKRHEFTAAELAEIDGELYYADTECVEPVLCFDAAAKETCTYGALVIVTCSWECVEYNGALGDVVVEFRADNNGCWSITKEKTSERPGCR